MNKIQHNKDGFTLIESLISIVLLAIVLTGGMALYYHSDALMVLASHKVMATEMAHNSMEDLKNKGFTQLPPSDTPTVAKKSFGSFTVTETVTVDDVDDPEGGARTVDYRRVSIDMDWQENSAIKTLKNVKLITLISPNG